MTADQLSASLIPVEIRVFRGATRDITFDVYLKLGEGNFAHVFSRNTGLDYKRLANYIQKGVTQLYIRQEDLDAYRKFIERTADSIFQDPKVSTERKIASLLNMTEQNMAEVFSQAEVSKETADSARKVVNNYVSLMLDDPKTLAIILNLVSHGEYLYYHSIAVSVFSLFVAKASGQFNRRTFEMIGMGGFLHDVGYTQIPKDILESEKELTPEQWEVMKQHPTIGLRMIESTPNIPDEVRYMVYQHHEYPNAKGYPNKLRNAVIYHPAKIVEIADSFSALISNRPFRKAYSVAEALKIIQSETGKHDAQLVKILTQIFSRSGGQKAAA
ncbi:MAG: HD domain-containing protein [Bdellovibrionales bacterium]|nr:HD domain-containing protein [Bdellovibrionales bacterium]